ncbi:MAG: cofactor-independent phosphoglycerate mutase [Oscillospiraceae bacterium]|nr:cofactor-independent phosphoglycerate mutase [Oscillospiraceae bacterium]
MKYLILLCDGMSDYPLEELGGLTPMQKADKPYMDKLAAISELGLVKTVQNDMKPGSDVANLSVLGYDPAIYYSGRSPFEAGSIGVDMKPTDVSLRCNLVTLSDDEIYADKTMLDYCADDISSEEAAVLIEHIDKNLGSVSADADASSFSFYSGVAYRHLLLWGNGTVDVGTLIPPHDILDKKIAPYIECPNLHKASDTNKRMLIKLMEESFSLLKDHPVNAERVKKGKRPANSIWLWGEGVKRDFPSFKEKFGKKAAMISAVDLLKGIGKFTDMEVLNVKGATGYLDTNFKGKCAAAVNALKTGTDLVYLHIEAPDECGHRGETAGKVKAIELIDELVLKPFLAAFRSESIKILICPDHATPLSLRTHTHDLVPYLIYDSSKPQKKAETITSFSESTAEASGNRIEKGYTLMEKFLGL